MICYFTPTKMSSLNSYGKERKIRKKSQSALHLSPFDGDFFVLGNVVKRNEPN